MWYYLDDSREQHGPFSEEELLPLTHTATVRSHTLVWSRELKEWQRFDNTRLRALAGWDAPPPLPVAALRPVAPPTSDGYRAVGEHPATGRASASPGGPSILPAASPYGPSGYPPAPAEITVDKLKFRFRTMWICLGVGLLLWIVLIGVPIMIAGFVFQLMLLHGLWSVVQDGRARSTPGAAIGFMFVPLYNIYWQFVLYAGLAEELNRHAQSLNVPLPNVGLARAFCWINIAAIIPILGLFIVLANLVIFPMMLHDLTTCATRILAVRAELAASGADERDLAHA